MEFGLVKTSFWLLTLMPRVSRLSVDTLKEESSAIRRGSEMFFGDLSGVGGVAGGVNPEVSVGAGDEPESSSSRKEEWKPVLSARGRE
jgi:hypothetical protein